MFQSLAFIGKAQRVGRRILSGQKFARGRYTWRVIDNGKVGGAVLESALGKREINELTCRKAGGEYPSRPLAYRELS